MCACTRWCSAARTGRSSAVGRGQAARHSTPTGGRRSRSGSRASSRGSTGTTTSRSSRACLRPGEAVAHTLVAVVDVTGEPPRAPTRTPPRWRAAALRASRFSALATDAARVAVASLARSSSRGGSARTQRAPPRPLGAGSSARAARGRRPPRGSVLVLMAISANEVLLDNANVPRVDAAQSAEVVASIVACGQLFQGWYMFAPGVPTVVDDDLRRRGDVRRAPRRPVQRGRDEPEGVERHPVPAPPNVHAAGLVLRPRDSRELAYARRGFGPFRDWILAYPQGGPGSARIGSSASKFGTRATPSRTCGRRRSRAG